MVHKDMNRQENMNEFRSEYSNKRTKVVITITNNISYERLKEYKLRGMNIIRLHMAFQENTKFLEEIV